MKKYIFALLALLIIFSACHKDNDIITNQTNIITTKSPINKIHQFHNSTDTLFNQQIITTIKTFQKARTNFSKQGTYTDYKLTDALFQMPLVLNYELGITGYYSHVEKKDTVINILNNGNETILDGKDMFNKYLDLENYIKTKLHHKKLYFAEFSIKDTTSHYITFKISLYTGVRSMGSFGQQVCIFPILPINQPPICTTTSTPYYVASMMTLAWIPSINTLYFKPYHVIYSSSGYLEASTSPGEVLNGINTWVYHSNSWDNISAGGTDPNGYNMQYYKWVNSQRIYYQNIYIGTSVRVELRENFTNNSDYTYSHIIYLYISRISYIPDLFVNNLPIII